MSKEEKTKIRRAKARPAPIVIAVMEDRIAMLLAAKTDPIYVELHANRCLELLDELKRAGNGGKTEDVERIDL